MDKVYEIWLDRNCNYIYLETIRLGLLDDEIELKDNVGELLAKISGQSVYIEKI